MTQRFSALESRLNNLGSGAAPAPAKAAAPAPAEEDDDDDVDLFGSDDEDDAEAERIKVRTSRDSRTVKSMIIFRPNALLLTMIAKPPRRPKRVFSSPSQTSSWMSNHGMMKLIWAPSKPKFVKSKPMVSSGELPNSSQSATASRNFKSVVSLKTIKSELTSSKKKFAPLKIT